MSVFWFFLAAVLIVIEATTLNLVTIWFAISALVSGVLGVFNVQIGVQIGVFFVLSVILLVFTMPFLKRYVEKEKIPTNADSILGKEAIVTEDIDLILGKGQIKVNGTYWSAKAEETILKGEKVKVKSIEGVKAVVIKKEEL